MTRKELKEKRLLEEKSYIEFLKDKPLSKQDKDKFRQTSIWKSFRETFKYSGFKELKNGKSKPIKNTDPLTLNPLNKTFNLHHLRLDSRLYTDLNEEYFLPLNSNSHDFLHWAHTQMCKDPTFLDRLNYYIKLMYRLNNGRDVKDFLN